MRKWQEKRDMLEWLIIFIIFLQKKNEQTSKKEKKGNNLNDPSVPLLNCHFWPLVSQWGMENSRWNSRFETKARKAVSSAVLHFWLSYQKKITKVLTFLKNIKKIFIAFNVLTSQQSLHFILKKHDCFIFNEKVELFLGRS